MIVKSVIRIEKCLMMIECMERPKGTKAKKK